MLKVNGHFSIKRLCFILVSIQLIFLPTAFFLLSTIDAELWGSLMKWIGTTYVIGYVGGKFVDKK